MARPPADKIIDARDMEPPEPFVQTMDALDPKITLLLILTREPYPLYQALKKNGYDYQVDITKHGTVEILIWYKQF